MKPLFDRLLVKEIKTETTTGGIIIPDTVQAAKELCKWEVVEVGGECKYVKQGDNVMTPAFVGTDIVELGKKEDVIYRVIREFDVIVVY